MPRILCVISVLIVALAMAVPASGQSTVFVSANDGTPLATDVYQPIRSGPHPVILIRTPYGRDGMAEPCVAFLLLGYACVAQDTRGRGTRAAPIRSSGTMPTTAARRSSG